LFGPIVLSFIVSVPALLTPPPEVVEKLPVTSTSVSVVLELLPVRRPPPPDEDPFWIVRSVIVTPVMLGFTSSSRSTSAPSRTV
jgi:hypothetical protein